MCKKYQDFFITTTDTVVGIGCPVGGKNFKRLAKLKNRDKSKKFVIMIGSIEQALAYPEFNKKAQKLAKKYWPGPVTLVLNENLALRIPDNQHLINLLKEIGPVYMTSANMSNEKTLSFEEAILKFNKIKKHYYFGNGSKKASKIIRVSDGRILRG